VARSAEADRERMKELAALGYISPGAGAAEGATPTPSGEALATQFHNLGGALMAAGKLDEARAKFEEAVRIQPSYGPSWYALAEIARLQGDPGRAFAALAEGFSRSRSMSAGRLEVLAEVAAQSGRSADAEALLERLRPRWGETTEYHTALGLLQQRRGRGDEALAHFARALEIAPAHAGAVAGMVTALRGQGREEEARERVQDALAKAGSSAPETLDLVAVALEQGWGADVEEVLRRIVGGDPGHVGARRNLAIGLLQQGKLVEAEHEMGEVLKRQAIDPSDHLTMGVILFQQDRTAEALAAFDRAAKAGLRSAELQVLRARALYLLGRRGEAEAALRDALVLHPGDADATRLLAVLERERR
jgi:tetratricopeptide (TPR) repeat protein